MNKLIFLLSIALGLVACSSEQNISDENALPSGIMQPAYDNGSSDATLFPEIKKQTMPSSMK